MIKTAIHKSFQLFQFEIKATFLHKCGVLKSKKYQNQQKLKLHLASGENYKEGWVNIDLLSKNIDLSLDLRKKFPFSDNSCKEIYSEHFLEHLEYPNEVSSFLKEAKRVLISNGKITIIVPDTVWPMQSYFEGYESAYFKICKKKKWHPTDYKTRIEHINFHFRQNGEHLYAYDEELLRMVLKNAGFSQIIRRDYDQKIDSPVHDFGNLSLVARNK